MPTAVLLVQNIRIKNHYVVCFRKQAGGSAGVEETAAWSGPSLLELGSE